MLKQNEPRFLCIARQIPAARNLIAQTLQQRERPQDLEIDDRRGHAPSGEIVERTSAVNDACLPALIDAVSERRTARGAQSQRDLYTPEKQCLGDER